MAVAAPTLEISAVKTSATGDSITPASETSSKSQTWKSLFQQPVNSILRRRQNAAEKHTKAAVTGTPTLGHSSHAVSPPQKSSSLLSESLVSLTSASLSSRNSYPSMVSSNTDATSISGVITTCGITCPVDSQSVKKYKWVSNNLVVYLAHDDIELPRDVVEQWETTDLDRLKTDLSEVVMKIYRKGVQRESRRRRNALILPSGPHEYDISFELRMSGRAAHDDQHVAIRPSIWLLCGSIWACKEIRAAMDEITWPTLPVEIHEGCVPIPSIAESDVDMNKLDLTDGYYLGDGITLYIHVEESSVSSACGLLCCATIKNGDAYSHYFSRIGGLITATNTLMSSQFGVSTAHGMLDNPWWHKKFWQASPAAEWEHQNTESSDDEAEDDFDGEIRCDSREGLYTALQVPHTPDRIVSFPLDCGSQGEGHRDPELVSRWRNATHLGVVSFLGASITTDRSLRNPVQLHDDTGNEADHAMIFLEPPEHSNFQPWNNKYRPRGAKPEMSIEITTYMSNDKLTQGPVSIICQADSPLNGHLLPGRTCLAIGGRMFKLRKLKVAAPLARGVSGTWVARGTELCGMIIAVSNPEPYAYMMGAEDLISNLGASCPSIETIEVFNSCNRTLKYGVDGTIPQQRPSSKLRHRLATGITSPRTMTDGDRPTIGIKKALSKTPSWRLGGSSPLHEAAGNEIYWGKAVKRHRKRSVRGLLSNMFRTKIEEIIQQEDVEKNNIAQGRELRWPSLAGNHTQYYYAQARRRCRPKKRHIVCTLEPISEVSSVVSFGADIIPGLEDIVLQSTTRTPATAFRHGPIRLHGLDLTRRDRDRFEHNAASSRAAYHWFSDFEGQQEEKDDEVGDLIDWWESWGVEDSCGLIDDEPPSPISTTSDNFPGISYSDTTSENSTSSYYPDSTPQGYFSRYTCGTGLQDIKQASINGLPEDGVDMPMFEVADELASDGNVMDSCIQGIMM